MKKLLSLFAVMVLLLAACTRGTVAPTDPQVVLEKNIGDEFRLVFESNPSTGYQWKVVDGMDGKVLELVEQYYQSTNEVTLVGGGGVEIWVFRATGVGQTTIELGYYPPSGVGTEPEQTETFTVIVDE